ncbi:ESPR-type extended signal peptide-containing protein [Dialister invisus]|uniref:ESPR-type extended signal peptide-containing protein n=1 Tax=Dialister invisus TaxID=218538 RepID=UPI0026DC113E|nr:ESPR-type extended signal peptide-containing protein [Dialister invisus]
MNQIYKVIWSRVKRCYVVVSEIAGSNGKNGGVASEKKSLPFHAFLCALALTGCLMPGVAEANTQYGPGASATGGDSVAVGDSAKATAGHATAIGTLTEADGTNSFVAGLQAKSGATAENSVAIGRGAQALGQKRVSEQFTASTIAIGNNATATENGDIVIGRQAKSTVSQYHNHPQGGNGAVVMGAEAASYGSRGDVVLGAGAEACLLRKDVTNPADKSEYSQGVAIGSRAKVYGTQSTSIGADSRSIGHSSIAIGGDDIDKAKPVLTAAIPDMATTGVQKNFNRELAVLYPGTTLGSAAINDSKNYVNTASIGNASMAIGMMTQSYGTGSTAIGVNTLTKGIASTGIGVMARSWGDKSLALGSRAETYGNKSTAVGDANTVGFDMTDGTTSGAASSAVGTDNKVYGNNSYAIGGGNTIGSATITETTEANGDKIKKVTAGTVKGSTAGAFGYKNTVTTDNAYVVGNNSTASADGAMVLGSSASVTGKNGVALGNNTKVANENAVAIGNGSETAAAVATPSATINGVAHNFAGVNPASTVSVGKAGAERTITNVAAGRISATSTDAINGSQLYAVTSEIDKGVAYAGDVKAAAAAANKFTRKLGEQTNIIGGVTDTSKLTDGNIGVVSNGTDTLNIKLAKDVKVDSVTTGNTVINNNGLTVGGKTYVTNNGINANNQKVTNVADGQVAAGSKDAVNGGQLHDAKNEVINKGLRFDADNNSEKTNKLGSKVTVNGDNNITTEITQTGDDTKIGVKLNKDIHVKTVTATDTVKASGVTMGGQTVANAAGANESGNYVTGLDNKTWNIQNPNIVSGRGATEDQLKVVSDEVKKQGANATDYRLVQNASSADGSYTVDTNGDIDLTVEDKNHAGQKETVKLKDIASKSKLDDVINKGLQFDANVGGVQTNKLGSKITIKGEGTGSDNDYSGENLKTFITQDPAGNTTIDVKMNKNLKVETIVATGENGKDGKIGINGKDGQTTNISVTRDGKPGVDGAPGTTTTRIVYQKPDGTNEEVATLNDGMKYGGDTGNVIKKKLNEQVNVVGGITDENKLTTEDNLGVVSDGSNNLKVRLAKALKGLESITAGDTFINNNGITISNGAAGNTVSLTKNGLDNGGNKITNVAAGDVSANSTDAVNGSQLHDVKTLAGQHTTVKAKDSNITVTEGTNGTGGKEYTVGLGDKVTLGTDPSKQVSIDGTTGIIKAGDKVTIDGTTGNIDAGKVKINGKDGTVNGLTNKTWDPNNITSGQAATEDQLKAVDQKITNTSEELTKKGMDFAGNDGEFHRNLGDKVTIKGEGTKAASEYSGENIKTFADANGNLTVKMDKNLKTETIVATGKNGKDGKIGINGKDGVTTNISVTRDGKPGVDGAPGATTTRIVYEKPDGTKEEVATLNDGMKYGGDTGNVIKKKLNEQVNVVGGITDTNKLTTEDNLGVVSDGNNNLKVRMAKDLKGLNSVTTNTLTVGDVKIDNSGINAGNKKITNVAAGDISANSTDAVNGGQLWKTNQTINNIGGAVNELGTRVNRVGAGAAALAALHPLDFDPDDKWDVAAGYGNYKDAHAVSVGAFYRPNEDTMFSVGGSFGGGENMVNAGVSVKLGQGNHVSTSRVALAKEVEDLKAIVKAQSAEIKAMRGAMQSGTSVMKDVNFPDVPKDHWAYSYVKSLADRGLLEGYPDGEFKGDRSMTRYEFAAIIYRALQNGAPIDSDMAKAIGEFDPEINRIKDLDRTRVDRISGKDNDRHKVERVRVNNESNKEKGDYRDVYGSHISPEA